MLAGESYNFFDPDLAAERERATELLRVFNRTEAPSARQRILRQLLRHIGQDSMIQPPFYCTYGHNTHIGDHVYLNWSCIIIDNNEVRIGDQVMVGPSCRSTRPPIPSRPKRGTRAPKSPGRS